MDTMQPAEPYTNYFFDTEFIDHPSGLILISLGIVDESGRSLYLENANANLNLASDWVLENVVSKLKGPAVPLAEFRQRLISFVGPNEKARFWAWWGSYDWTLFCRSMGGMLTLPEPWDKHYWEMRPVIDAARAQGIQPIEPGKDEEHNALADALALQKTWLLLRQ